MITNHPSFGPFPALPCVVVFIHLMAGISSAATVSVSTVSELQSALNSADPGDVIEASDGIYALSSDLSITRSGTTNDPIVVKAQNKLQSEITGSGRIMFDKVSNVKLEGFYITIDAEQGGLFWRGIIQVEDCNNVRICYNHLKLNEVSSTVGNWIGILGYTGQSHHNRIDHNLFQDKTFMGDFVMIGGGSTGNEYGSEYDRIDHNHFSNFVYSAANGYETIRIGSNSDGNISRDYYTTIEDNLFEKCSGEGELFSLKCGSCTVRRNTFVDCYGAVCLRGGNGHIVNGNYFIRKDSGERRGGIKIYGTDHLVFNNYFENLNGFSDTSSLVIKSGYPAGSGLAGGADAIAASNVMVVFNSWVNCRPIEIGSPNYSNAPSDCVIANNILYGNHENRALVSFRDDVLNFVYAGNIIFPTGGSSTFQFADGATPVTFTQDEFREVDPQLTDSGDMYRLTNSGSAIDYATGTYSFVTNDIEGHSRGALKDVGADEYSTAPPARPAALSPEDVGPWAEEIPDLDHDGIPDAWEIQYGLNPTNAADASQDEDSDGASNVGEYVAGTDPTNPASIFMLNAPAVGGAGNVLNWASVSSRVYSVYWATNLPGTNAFSLMTNNLPATPELNVYTDEVYSAEQTIFYRINVEIEE